MLRTEVLKIVIPWHGNKKKVMVSYIKNYVLIKYYQKGFKYQENKCASQEVEGLFYHTENI